MIISGENVKLNIVWDGKVYESLSPEEVEKLFSKTKTDLNNLMPKQMKSIPNCYAYFCSDKMNNQFTCKIYKTMHGTDRWVMLMKDENEGYALYQNPESREYELSWYHKSLSKPLEPEEEKKRITCYIPPDTKK